MSDAKKAPVGSAKRSRRGGDYGGVPGRLLMEAIGHPVAVETDQRETFRGILKKCHPATMALELEQVVKFTVDGQRFPLKCAALRGSSIRLITLPSVLTNMHELTHKPLATT